MKAVKLWTRDGGFVAEVQVPPAYPGVELIVWGWRYFVWDSGRGRYVETLAWHCPNVPAVEGEPPAVLPGEEMPPC